MAPVVIWLEILLLVGIYTQIMIVNRFFITIYKLGWEKNDLKTVNLILLKKSIVFKPIFCKLVRCYALKTVKIRRVSELGRLRLYFCKFTVSFNSKSTQLISLINDIFISFLFDAQYFQLMQMTHVLNILPF